MLSGDCDAAEVSWRGLKQDTGGASGCAGEREFAEARKLHAPFGTGGAAASDRGSRVAFPLISNSNARRWGALLASNESP